VISLLARRRPAVLVIRTDGIGDMLLFEPALRSLAAAWPDHQLHLWAPGPSCELMAAHPYVHRRRPILRGFKEGNLGYYHSLCWRARTGYMLGRFRFDLALYPAQSPEPLGNWLLASARAAHRWLTWGDLQNQFDWQRDRAARSATRLLSGRPAGGHELLRNAHLAGQWGPSIEPEQVRLYLSRHAMREAGIQVQLWRDAAEDIGAAAVVGVVTGSSMGVKHYPTTSWASAIAQLWDRHRVLCALVGGQDDQPAMRQLAAALDGAPLVAMENSVGLLTLAGIVKQLDAVISVDTAAAHFAVAQNVPTVVLLGGGHPERFFPWPGVSHALALTHPMPCAGCFNRCIHPAPQCLTSIDPAQIVAAYDHLRGRVVAPAALAA
jgi:ADP-heptose:LPS heptosyltransferase